MISGVQISSARRAKGWTQAKLAEKMGVSTETVSKWEQGTYRPDEEKVNRLCELLSLHAYEEDGTPSNLRMFNEDHMSAFLKGRFLSGDYPNALKALSFAKEKHEGMFRKPEEQGIPYIIHPLTLACHALAMGLEDDVLLSALLLHDVCEDCDVLPEELPVCPEAQEAVRLVTKKKDGFSTREYYAAIAENPMACLVKCIDRCNNVSGMATGFTTEKIREYIRETEKYYPHLLRVVKAVPAYNNAAWLLSYQIRSVLQTAKKIH